MHILLLTRVDDEQWARLQAIVAENPKATISRNDESACQSGTPVTAIVGAPPPELIELLHQLEWVQLRADCLDAWCDCVRLLHDRRVTVTRCCGSYNDTVPDHAMMLLLAFARDLPGLLRQREAREFAPEDLQPRILAQSTVAVLGLGNIGAAVARRAAAFDLRVIGVDPAPAETPPGLARLVEPEALLEILPEADFVVATLPLTTATRGLLGAEALAAMKPGAVLINVGRGQVVDLDALLVALDRGPLAGAALDLTEPNPLPEDHPLWTHPRVLLTGRSAAVGSHYAAHQFEIVCDNVRRYIHGEPLCHVVPPPSDD